MSERKIKKNRDNVNTRTDKKANGPLRGIEASLKVWSQVRQGRFASESLRKISDRVSEKDRPLVASLVYALVRRQTLWWEIARTYVNNEKNLSLAVKDALMVGTAGALELRTFEPKVLVNALVDWTKERDERGASLVNAVLRKVVSMGPKELARIEKSGAIQDRALVTGTPLWVADNWENGLGLNAAKELIELQSQPASLSLRLSPGADKNAVIKNIQDAGYDCAESNLLPMSVRLDGSALPPRLPGYGEGLITPQSESSMLMPLAMKGVEFKGPILDMCAGRGGKTGELANLFPHAHIEAWDISDGRVKAGRKEMSRLGLESQVTFKTGNALELDPEERPGAVFLDVPCSGSGTWRRHPEGKWKLSQDDLVFYAEKQRGLLNRALDLVRPGGIVLYSSCSLFREENEQVIARIISERRNVTELEPASVVTEIAHRGRPWGYSLWPESPWMDGFFMALLTVKG